MKTKNLINLFILMLVLFVPFYACEEDKNEKEIIEVETDEKAAADDKVNQETDSVPKYVFVFIGDGMSSPQINITEAALNDPVFKLKSVGIGELNLRKLPVTGMQTTYAEDRYITGSAASGTALATGQKTTIGTISMNGDHSEDIKTIAEMSRDKGMKVGVISSVSIDHATPACFYAHNESRNNYQEIGQDLINSEFDYFAGGNVRFNKYTDYTLDDFKSDAEAKGYSYVSSRSDFNALDNNSGKVIATLKSLQTFTGDGSAMPYAIDLDEQSGEDDKITLAEFTQKGIDILDNENGFFMMVEGGKIDWACHANDVVSAAMDLMAFDDAIGAAIDFYNKHPDETLIIVTGDHECGGLTLGFAATGYETSFNLLNYQSRSFWSFTNDVRGWAEAGDKIFEEALVEVKAVFGLGDAEKGLALSDYETGLLEDAFNRSMSGESAHSGEELAVIYGYYDPFTVTVTHILNNKAGIDWTTYSHTGTPVPVFAMGAGQDQFGGYYDNTDIGKKIIEIAQLNQ